MKELEQRLEAINAALAVNIAESSALNKEYKSVQGLLKEAKALEFIKVEILQKQCAVKELETICRECRSIPLEMELEKLSSQLNSEIATLQLQVSKG
jgi:hypothetical protein